MCTVTSLPYLYLLYLRALHLVYVYQYIPGILQREDSCILQSIQGSYTALHGQSRASIEIEVRG